MTPARQKNLERLLRPRHVAAVGGRDAETVIKECRRIGFAGPIWPVNPQRQSIAGVPCFKSIDELPEAPDAVFLAVPAEPAIETVARLSALGAGGVVCYTAGFDARGAQGGEADKPLTDVVGDMALVGPNCYGLINYIDRVALWPFAHGGYCPGYGVAIITQSGMLSSDITMNQRSLPLAYMISAGNQSVLQLEDYLEVLCQREEVRAIGLHIEGLKDIDAFSAAAHQALELKKPVVVLKTGTSKLGSALTVSHTGSLSGEAELYQALFNKEAIISVNNPSQLIETLKFICVSGVPAGKRLMGFTCSGGGATMLADHAEKVGLEFPEPSAAVAGKLASLLPKIADVTNPLDYTTPIWGIPDKVRPVFETALQDRHDAAVIVQDYPLPGLDESKAYYLNDADAFVTAAAAAGLPAAVCSTLPENIDIATREKLIARGVTPAQGIHETLEAINAAAWYGQQRDAALGRDHQGLIKPVPLSGLRTSDEWTAKRELEAVGFNIPKGRVTDSAGALAAAREIGYPLVLKMNSPKIAHKTEVGAVHAGLENDNQLVRALKQMPDQVRDANPELVINRFLVEKMLSKPLAELMVGIRSDQQFGLAMTLSSGGILVELIADATTLLLPASEKEIQSELGRLRIAPLLDGFRGSEPVDKAGLASMLHKLADYAITRRNHIAEIEINPLFVYANEFCIVDVLMHYHRH